MSFHSPPRSFARFRISCTRLPLDSSKKKNDQLRVPTTWHNERTIPSPFLLAHGGTNSSVEHFLALATTGSHATYGTTWDETIFDFCFHPKMRALIGSVTSAQDVFGQQCLDQSSVQRHSRTLELPRNLILVLRGFLVSRAVSGRAFLEHRKTTQQASQLSFGCIVPSSLPRPLSLIATRSTIFKFECAFFVLGTAQLFQEQGRFSHDFPMCFESFVGTPLVEVLKRQPSAEKCIMDSKDVLHENVNCFGAVATTSLHIRSEAVKNAPSFGGRPVLRTNPEHRTHHHCHVCGGHWKQDMKKKKHLFQTVPHLLSSQRRTRSCQERRLLPTFTACLKEPNARHSGVNLSRFADDFGAMPLPMRFPNIPNLWLATSDPPAKFFRVAAAHVCHFLHVFCVHLPQQAPLESSPSPQAHWWERSDRVWETLSWGINDWSKMRWPTGDVFFLVSTCFTQRASHWSVRTLTAFAGIRHGIGGFARVVHPCAQVRYAWSCRFRGVRLKVRPHCWTSCEHVVLNLTPLFFQYVCCKPWSFLMEPLQNDCPNGNSRTEQTFLDSASVSDGAVSSTSCLQNSTRRRREEKRREEKRREEKRRDETRRDETRRDETRRDETRRDETRRDEKRREEKRREEKRREEKRREEKRRVAQVKTPTPHLRETFLPSFAQVTGASGRWPEVSPKRPSATTWVK